MIKARATIKGQDTLIFGLSRGNVEGLLDNQPILINGRELAVPFQILMVGNETEEDIMEDLRSIGLAVPKAAS